MKLVILDNQTKSVEEILNILKTDKKTHVFVDQFGFFSFLGDNTNQADLILLFSDEVLSHNSTDITTFIKHFDIYVPIFTYTINQLSLIVTVNYTYEYTKYYTDEYIQNLSKIRDAFLRVKDDSIYSVFSFSEKMTFYNSENMEKANLSIFPGVVTPTVESGFLISSLNYKQRQLLSYLMLNCEGAELEEIMLYIWNSHDESKRQNAYTLVCSLKRTLENKTSGKYTIKKINKKYKLAQHNLNIEQL